MKHISMVDKKGLFKPLIESQSIQAAAMVLQPGQSSSGKVTDEHPNSEQWLFVVSGSGRAKIANRAISLKAGSLLLIERNEPHQVTNTGKSPLVTINFYAPPAYTRKGNVKRQAKS
jgi:mannose-6-phosphate isomerase-like protein (cupin superfamily)